MYIIDRIRTEAAELTPDQIEVAARYLDPPVAGEVTLHIVQSDDAKRLWALAHQYDGIAQLAEFEKTYRLGGGDEDSTIQKATQMAGLCRALAWAEIRHDAGDEKAIWHRCLGLREKFTLVSTTSPFEDMKVAIEHILPVEVVEVLKKRVEEQRAAARRHEEERKPQ